MDRREFVKMLGAGGLVVGLGAIAGLGCSNRNAEVTGPPEAGDTEVATCPNCQAKNRVQQWGEAIKCWKCGHVWSPQKSA